MKQFIGILLLVFSLAACKEEISDPCSNKFEQTALFTNLADKLILPAYQDLQVKVGELSLATDAFTQDISTSKLQALRSAWQSAYLSWQTVAPYNFGPADVEILRAALNNYPINVDALVENIAAATWDLDAIDTYDKGFPALDYLLFGAGTDETAIVEYFSTTPAALQYLNAISTQIKTKVDNTTLAWTTTYRETFIANTGTADGTALSQIVNGINEHYENLKRNKLGIPSGIVALGIPRPNSVEARFSGISLELMQTALQANQELFNGKGGLGLDDYLNEIDARKGEELLSEVINTQYEQLRAELNKLTSTLSNAVETENEQVIEAYKAAATQVVHLKTDMPSVLCVAITYVDNPSDSD